MESYIPDNENDARKVVAEGSLYDEVNDILYYVGIPSKRYLE